MRGVSVQQLAEGGACQILRAIAAGHDVVFDANATELAEGIHFRPVHMRTVRAGLERGEQRGNEIQPGFDGDDEVFAQRARSA